jgi:hypothetical protein
MSHFPDLVVSLSSISTRGRLGWLSMDRDSDKQGPGRTGKAVCISGSENGRWARDGLKEQSKRHFDEGDYPLPFERP